MASYRYPRYVRRYRRGGSMPLAGQAALAIGVAAALAAGAGHTVTARAGTHHHHGSPARSAVHEVIDEFDVHNLCTAEGLTSWLGVYFHGDTQITGWYVGLFEGNYTPVDSDTAAAFATAATETTAYTSATRPAYSPAAAASKAISNTASMASFTFNDSKTLYGAFLASNPAKNGATGVLFSAARFTTPKTVANNDQLLITYTFSAASA